MQAVRRNASTDIGNASAGSMQDPYMSKIKLERTDAVSKQRVYQQ
jgi:hypothetical protein